jgi:TonB family protein
MQLKLAAACLLALAATSIFAQQPEPGSIANSDERKPREKIYDSNSGLIPPVLVLPQPPQISTEKCKKKFQRSESVQLSFFVTSDGKPRWITFLHALGNELDQTALDLTHADRFTPATRDGEPVAVWQSIDISFQSCREKPTDRNLYPDSRLIAPPAQTLGPPRDPPHVSQMAIPRIDAKTIQHIGGKVSPPVPLNTPEAHYSIEARKKKIQGQCLVSLVVDAEGMPQNPHMIRPAGYGLDERALEAIKHYRFRPSLKDGFEPVPVMLTVEVNFRLY